jgi:hypothetical protein
MALGGTPGNHVPGSWSQRITVLYCVDGLN